MLKMVFKPVCKVPKLATMLMETMLAIRAYSMAVTPFSSLMKRLMTRVVAMPVFSAAPRDGFLRLQTAT